MEAAESQQVNTVSSKHKEKKVDMPRTIVKIFRRKWGMGRILHCLYLDTVKTPQEGFILHFDHTHS